VQQPLGISSFWFLFAFSFLFLRLKEDAHQGSNKDIAVAFIAAHSPNMSFIIRRIECGARTLLKTAINSAGVRPHKLICSNLHKFFLRFS